jgi:hypothetical protein
MLSNCIKYILAKFSGMPVPINKKVGAQLTDDHAIINKVDTFKFKLAAKIRAESLI